MCKILVVEDKEQQRCHYVEELVKEGHRVVAVDQSEQALRLLDDTRIDLVVMHLAQPEGKGLNNLQEMVARHREVKVIIHSDSPLFMLDFRSWAADRLLSNAFEMSELKKTINELTASEQWA